METPGLKNYVMAFPTEDRPYLYRHHERTMSPPSHHGVELLWIPLGAGGWFVRLNGRLWEAVHAAREHRPMYDLYHAALIVRVPDGHFTIENAWPIPDAHGASRGVVVDGPVFTPWLGALRFFRYEVRCWADGVISDADWAVGRPQLISGDVAVARRVLDVLPSVPAYTWGREIQGTNDMWNSNSTISWVLTRSGLPAAEISPPSGGRAPGWRAGCAVSASLSAAVAAPLLR